MPAARSSEWGGRHPLRRRCAEMAHEMEGQDKSARSSRPAPTRVTRGRTRFRKAMPLNDEEVETMVADFDALQRGRPRSSRGVK